MLSIGAFARIGRVSHRMLRHWDAAGLLVPARVDESTGYRSYDPSQLERLHRIVALRQLGFGLDDVAAFLEDGVDTDRLARMLRVRRAEVERDHRIAAARLVDVERRLRLIEKGKSMSSIEIVEKPLPAVRLAAGTATVTEQEQVSDVIGPIYGRVAGALGPDLGAAPAMAQYDVAETGMQLVAGFPYAGPAREGLDIVELPAVETAICGVHLGAMDRIAETWQALHAEIVARGYAPSGPCRELYLRSEPEPQRDWVTELQQPVVRA